MILIRKWLSPEDQADVGEAKLPKETKSDKPATNVELAKALEDVRRNSVSKEEYERLQTENRDLITQILNGEGGSGNGQATPPETVDIISLKEELYGPRSQNLSNLEVVTKTLQLRDAVIKESGKDPFLPFGAKIQPTSEDVEKAQRVADILAECVEQADGDSGVFTALLQSRINNDSPILTAKLKKMGIISK